MNLFLFYAALAGTFGAMSGVVGKVSVASTFELHLIFRIMFFAANAVCTGQMWRYYLKALALGSTPVCSIVNTGVNFAVSAILGILVFGETVTALWCLGAAAE